MASSKRFLASSLSAALLFHHCAVLAASPASSDHVERARGPAVGADRGNVRRAREAFERGVRLADQALWLEALEAFRASAALKPHAVTWYNVGYSERALGHYTRALQAFELAQERSEATRPPELPERLSKAAREYTLELNEQLAVVLIDARRSDVRLLVDGRPLERTSSERATPVMIAGTRPPAAAESLPKGTLLVRMDPGSHRFQWLTPDGAEKNLVRRFAPGEHAVVSLQTPEDERPQPGGSGRSSAEAGSRTRSWLGPALLAAGGVSITVGAVFGIIAWRQKSGLSADCPDRICTTAEHDRLNAAGRDADIATAALGVGIVALGAGAAFTIWDAGAVKQGAARIGRSTAAASGVRLELGPASARVFGRF